ncbi:hypothetical protein STEG23_000902 [Scotinomys teguina]
MDIENVVHVRKYYSAEKNNDIMKFADKWLELETIILSEVTQTQKDKHAEEKLYYHEICRQMKELENIILSEVTQTQKDKHAVAVVPTLWRMYSHTLSRHMHFLVTGHRPPEKDGPSMDINQSWYIKLQRV